MSVDKTLVASGGIDTVISGATAQTYEEASNVHDGVTDRRSTFRDNCFSAKSLIGFCFKGFYYLETILKFVDVEAGVILNETIFVNNILDDVFI